jgi:hypothetical protein
MMKISGDKTITTIGIDIGKNKPSTASVSDLRHMRL